MILTVLCLLILYHGHAASSNLNLAFLRDFPLMTLRPVTRQLMTNAMVQSHVSPSCRYSICTKSDSFTVYDSLDISNQLSESKFTDGRGAEEIVIVLVLYRAWDKDSVSHTTQGGQVIYQRKPKFLL